MNVWKTRHYMSDHGGQLTANSKSLVQRQRRTDDQVSWVGNVAQEVGTGSRCLLAMSEAGITQSMRYCVALCCWHRRTVTPSLYCTLSHVDCFSQRELSQLAAPEWLVLSHVVCFSQRELSQLAAPEWLVLSHVVFQSMWYLMVTIQSIRICTSD